MAVIARNPAAEDFQRFLDTQNPYKNQFTGLYDQYSDVINGSNWKNQQIQKQASLLPNTGGAAPGNTSTSTGRTGSRYSVLRATKNPALQSLFDFNLGRVRGASTANDLALNDYIASLSKNNAASAGDVSQEGAFIGDAYNGNLAGSLSDSRNRAADVARAANADADAKLAALRTNYRTGAEGEINTLATNLGNQRAAYEGRVSGEIGAEEAARAGLRGKLGIARRAATDLAIADANRSQKALFSQDGGAGSSYFGRMAVGVRNKANTSLANDLVDQERADYGVTRGERASLTDRLAALERGEIAGTGEARIRLNDVVAGRARDDLGYVLGRTNAINDTLANNERADIAYVRGQGVQGIGARRLLRNNASADRLAPITAREAVLRSDLANASQMGSIDLANNFYGIDDGGAYGPTVPRGYRPLNGGYSRGGLNYFDAQAEAPSAGFAAGGAPRLVRSNGRSPAEEEYRRNAGAYPDEDPNFEPNLWAYAQQAAASNVPRMTPTRRPIAAPAGHVWVPGDVGARGYESQDLISDPSYDYFGAV